MIAPPTHRRTSVELSSKKMKGGRALILLLAIFVACAAGVWVRLESRMQSFWKNQQQLDDIFLDNMFAVRDSNVSKPQIRMGDTDQTNTKIVLAHPPASHDFAQQAGDQAEDSVTLLDDPENAVNASLPRVVVVGVWMRYPSLMRLQVASLRRHLRRSSLTYVAVLNSFERPVNRQLARTASALGVEVFALKNRKRRPSYNHAFGLNAVYHYLLHSDPNVTQAHLRPGLDTLLILDTDMILVAPLDLHEIQMWSHVRTVPADGGTVRYLWPNLVALRLPTLDLYQELNFSHCPYRRADMDSGGCTAIFIDQHPEVNLTDVSSQGCNDTSRDYCRFYWQQHNLERPTMCKPPQLLHQSVYHLGSAGSNYLNCPEIFLQNRRRDVQVFLKTQLSNSTIERHGIEQEVE